MSHAEETHIVSIEIGRHGQTLVAADHEQMNELVDLILDLVAKVLSNVHHFATGSVL